MTQTTNGETIQQNIYTPEGWIDAAGLLELMDKRHLVCLFVPGGRGIGKTYSFLAELLSLGKPFIFLRRRPDEASLQADPTLSELAKPLEAEGRTLRGDRIAKDLYRLTDSDTGEELATVGALSTMATIRGANFDKYDIILFDEFIPEPHQRKIQREGWALKNLYETINRNRELENPPRKPVKLIALSNAFDIAHDTLREFGLVEGAEQLLQTGEEIYIKGAAALVLPQHSPISERKKATALYANENTDSDFARFSLGNKFILNDFSFVQKKNLQEYMPMLRVGTLYAYKHKSRPEYYITTSKADTPKEYNDNINDLERFRRDQRSLLSKYYAGRIKFNNYNSARLFEEYFKK